MVGLCESSIYFDGFAKHHCNHETCTCQNSQLSKIPLQMTTMAWYLFLSNLSMNHVPENGLWCYGSEWIFERYRFGRLPSNVESDLVPAGINPFFVLHGRKNWALSRKFLYHVQHCYGARELVAKLERTPSMGAVECVLYSEKPSSRPAIDLV